MSYTLKFSLSKEHSQAAIQEKAQSGELYFSIPAAYIKTKEPYFKIQFNVKKNLFMWLSFGI